MTKFLTPSRKGAKKKNKTFATLRLGVKFTLVLRKSKAAAKTQSEIDIYERQIKKVDESIDQLVYELYGLTEDEIKIVEGK